jgi:hypothetical protein
MNFFNVGIITSASIKRTSPTPTDQWTKRQQIISGPTTYNPFFLCEAFNSLIVHYASKGKRYKESYHHLVLQNLLGVWQHSE